MTNLSTITALSFANLAPAGTGHVLSLDGTLGQRSGLFSFDDCSVLVAVCKGSALFSVDGQVWPVTRGEVAVVPPASAAGFAEAVDLQCSRLAFRAGLMGPLAESAATRGGYRGLLAPGPVGKGGPSRLRLGHERLKVLRATMGVIAEETAGRQPGWAQVADGRFLELAALLCRWYQMPEKVPVADDEKIAKAAAYMEANLGQKITLRDIADKACLSERHLARLFRQSHGASPHQYLMKVRMQAACELLRQGRHQVLEVAALCGFEDSNHFSRQFHRALGLSPREYRERSKAE